MIDMPILFIRDNMPRIVVYIIVVLGYLLITGIVGSLVRRFIKAGSMGREK